jgi:hypothetical protein
MTKKDKSFLLWFIKRLKNKHKEDPEVIKQLSNLLSNNVMLPKELSLDTIDKQCKLFYPDFDLDRSPEFTFGYSENERQHMRRMIVSVIQKHIDAE